MRVRLQSTCVVAMISSLNRGTFDIGESIIDGGEALVLELD
jgi:hypothetical protein